MTEQDDVAAGAGERAGQAAGKERIVVLDDGAGPAGGDVVTEQTAEVGVVVDDEDAEARSCARLATRWRWRAAVPGRRHQAGSGRPGPGTRRDRFDIGGVVVTCFLRVPLAPALGVVGALLLRAAPGTSGVTSSVT